MHSLRRLGEDIRAPDSNGATPRCTGGNGYMASSAQARNYALLLVLFVFSLGAIVASLPGDWNTVDGSKHAANVSGIAVGMLSLILGFSSFLQATELNEIKSQQEERNLHLRAIETQLKQRQFVDPGVKTLLELHKDFWDESLAEARSVLTGTQAYEASAAWLKREDADTEYTLEHSTTLDKVDRLCSLVLRALHVATSDNVGERRETFAGLGLTWWTHIIVNGEHLHPAYVEQNWKSIARLHDLLGAAAPL